jgi:probable rRNA maturation factor
MARLNSEWRGRDRATDVLSFSLLEGAFAERRGRLLGDVVIGVETAARRARAGHRSLDEVVARLLIHGTLHLLGHDHARAAQARVMRAEERRLWRALRAVAA